MNFLNCPSGTNKAWLNWTVRLVWIGLDCNTFHNVEFFGWVKGGKSFQKLASVKSRLPNVETFALAWCRSGRLPRRCNARIHNLRIFCKCHVLDFKVAVPEVADVLPGRKWRLACLSEKGVGRPDSRAGSHKIKGGDYLLSRSHNISVPLHKKVDDSSQLAPPPWFLMEKRGHFLLHFSPLDLPLGDPPRPRSPAPEHLSWWPGWGISGNTVLYETWARSSYQTPPFVAPISLKMRMKILVAEKEFFFFLFCDGIKQSATRWSSAEAQQRQIYFKSSQWP